MFWRWIQDTPSWSGHVQRRENEYLKYAQLEQAGRRRENLMWEKCFVNHPSAVLIRSCQYFMVGDRFGVSKWPFLKFPHDWRNVEVGRCGVTFLCHRVPPHPMPLPRLNRSPLVRSQITLIPNKLKTICPDIRLYIWARSELSSFGRVRWQS